jgi:hypothetical protein
MSKQKNGFPRLSLKILKGSFLEPQNLKKTDWRTSGSVLDLRTTILYDTNGYELKERDLTNLIFVLEDVKEDTQNNEQGLCLHWRLWDTKVTFESFVSETKLEQDLFSKADFVCYTLLGGEIFEDTIQQVIQMISSDPVEIYETCCEQEEVSFENLVQVLN